MRLIIGYFPYPVNPEGLQEFPQKILFQSRIEIYNIGFEVKLSENSV